ncbi:MAG: response regulator [Oligoflexia bacterium]|nr:response regulator [Oligoflexia bacterium]
MSLTETREESPRNRTRAELSRPTLLVVDDEPAEINRAQSILAGSDYQVITCKNAIEALKILSNRAIDCVVTDIAMPVMDGHEMIRTIRAATSKNRSVPILVLSRMRRREDVTAAVQAGADDYILKPIDEQVFLDKIEANIRKGDAKRHIFEHTLYGDSIPAEFKISAKIMAVSEADLTIALPMPATATMNIELASKLFSDIGIAPPLLRLIYSRKIPEGAAISSDLPYEARYSFVGIPENDSRKIRAWLHRQAIERRK